MKHPVSKAFRFQKLLSENSACQTWLASHAENGLAAIVKSSTSPLATEPAAARQLLLQSFRLQGALRWPRVVRARRKVTENDVLFIEYPYLDTANWQELTPALLWSQLEWILPEICCIVDYVHQMGYVHGDLKLANFLVRLHGRPQVRLVDLDFLCPIDSKLSAKVFGTPERIAPEILANERIVAQSDNYSLGRELQSVLSLLSTSTELSGAANDALREKISWLAEKLVAEDYLQRPRVLLAALVNIGLLDKQRHADIIKVLLRQIVRSRRAQIDKKELLKRAGFADFVRRQCRVMGLSDELLEAFSDAAQRSELRTFRILGELIHRASVEQNGDYWHLPADDQLLEATYSALQAVADGRPRTSPGSADNGGDAAHLMARAPMHEQSGHLEQAYLSYRAGLRLLQNTGSTDQIVVLLEQAGRIANQLGRLSQAAEHFETLYALPQLNGAGRLGAALRLLPVLLNTGRLNRAQAVVASLSPYVEETTDQEAREAFRRIHAWLLISQREYQRSQELLDSVIGHCRQNGFAETLAMALYTQGMLYWYRGQFDAARREVAKAIQVAEEHSITGRVLPIFVGFAVLLSDFGDHESVLRVSKQSMKHADSSGNRSSFAIICYNLATSYTRLAERQKADYWMQRTLEAASATGGRTTMITHYQQLAFLKLNFGELAAAKEAAYRALELVEEGEATKTIAKAYHVLCEAALMEGNLTQCRGFAETAILKFEHLQDEASLAEIRMLVLLCRHYIGPTDLTAEITAASGRLAQLRCRYYAAVGYYHVLVQESHSLGPQDLAAVESLLKPVDKSRVPVFAALAAVIHDGQSTAGPRARLASFKEAFRIMLAAQQNFLALVTGMKLAALYREQAQPRHARKFLRQSLRLAQALGNNLLAGRIQELLNSTGTTEDHESQLISSFHDMSKILKGIGDYRESLQRLVQFAVDQSGAERGVLLLTSRGPAKLHIAASVNCDDQSLTDILDISRNVPSAVVRDAMPLIIENALEDKRTNQFRSVLLHNIMSVMAVPLTYDEETLGVLYLDHHAIPTLFDKEDITYILTIANVIAVALATVDSFCNLRFANVELQRDLGRLGYSGTFVTRNRSIEELLGKLGAIAKTDAPVLLVGESGTGKEILCQMIHSQSLRSEHALVKLNCAAIPETMIEAELFGVEHGAATQTVARDGRFVAANGGTLYLDEIGNMPLSVQMKVLRVLEYQQFEKVGSNRPIQTDVRFIYATNMDLSQMIIDKTFREDLLYRINTFMIEIPPLRERPDDIPLLIEHFLQIHATGKKAPIFTNQVIEAMMRYSWPGNVRQLKNAVERCCILYPGERITAAMLPAEIVQPGSAGPVQDQAAAGAEIARLRQALADSGWNLSATARALNMPLTTLRRKIKKYGIRKNR
ncbi:MAG: sigma 54-interacting transcriptional regulator [Candidatus Zixiibacteriota bacterium]